MAKRLKIYACSGVGDTPKVSAYNYWTDNTNTLSNTKAVNVLLSILNLAMVKVERQFTLTKEQVVELLNTIDLYVVCLDAAKRYTNDNTTLSRAGRVIGAMLDSGMFTSGTISNEERDKNLDALLLAFDSRMRASGDYAANNKWLEWWQSNVVDNNYVGLSVSQQAVVQQAIAEGVSGIGAAVKELDWRDNKELSKYLSNAGTYFLYTYFTDKQLSQLPAKNRKIFTIKRAEQRNIYNYCLSLYAIYGTESMMQNIIRGGIIADFGVEPEMVCEDVVAGRRSIEGIGQLSAAAIVSIITVVLGTLAAVISAICKAVAQSKAAQYAAIDKQAIEAATPNPEDFNGLDMKNTTTTAGASGKLPLLIIGAAAVMSFLKKK